MLIVWLSSYLVRHRDAIGDSWRALMKPLLVAGALVGLLLVQPDFGSAMLILAVTGGLVWLGGARIRNLALPMVAGLALMSVIVHARALPRAPAGVLQRSLGGCARQRLPAGAGADRDRPRRPDAASASAAASSSSTTCPRRTPTSSSRSPPRNSASSASCVVIALFALFTWRALRIGLRCMELRQPFGGYVAFGIGLWISLQAFVSMGVNLGILPTKGLTLPLISSGGSQRADDLRRLRHAAARQLRTRPRRAPPCRAPARRGRPHRAELRRVDGRGAAATGGRRVPRSAGRPSAGAGGDPRPAAPASSRASERSDERRRPPPWRPGDDPRRRHRRPHLPGPGGRARAARAQRAGALARRPRRHGNAAGAGQRFPDPHDRGARPARQGHRQPARRALRAAALALAGAGARCARPSRAR